MKTTYFGLTTYEKSMQYQAQVYQLVASTGFPAVLGFEYYPVITLGRSARAEAELMQGLKALADQGFEVAETDRGGQATLHSPGQLVIYPIVPLHKLQISVREFVAILEQATVDWLAQFKIEAFRKEDAGVFTSSGKIAFIGIRVEKGITRHGISINLNNDLKLFSGIRACGQSERALDSVFEHGRELDLKEAFENWILKHKIQQRNCKLRVCRVQNLLFQSFVKVLNSTCFDCIYLCLLRNAFEEEGNPSSPTSRLAEVSKMADILIAIRFKVSGQVKARLTKQFFLEEEERNDHSPNASVPIQKRVNYFKLSMKQCQLNHYVWSFGVPVCFPSIQMLLKVERGRGNKSRL